MTPTTTTTSNPSQEEGSTEYGANQPPLTRIASNCSHDDDDDDDDNGNMNFSKYKNYLPYCLNDKNTTIGMPHVKKKVKPFTSATATASSESEQTNEEKGQTDQEDQYPDADADADPDRLGRTDSGIPVNSNHFDFRRHESPKDRRRSRRSRNMQWNGVGQSSRQVARTSSIRISSNSNRNSNRNSTSSNPNSPTLLEDKRFSVATQMRFHSTTDLSEWGQARRQRESDLIEKQLKDDAERDMVNVELRVRDFWGMDRVELSEDVYSFVFACSYFSLPFLFAMAVVAVKYLCYIYLILDIKNDFQFTGRWEVQAVKLWLIPVAVSMQDDLMTVFFNVANIKYDGTVGKKNKHASYQKWVVSNVLRCIDGLLSLTANFYVMLMTNKVQDIFLNFAALHFLQFIDDVFYSIAERGFLNDRFEGATLLCKQMKLPRRTSMGPSRSRKEDFLTSFDTFFLFGIIVTCGVIWVLTMALYYWGDDLKNWSPKCDSWTKTARDRFDWLLGDADDDGDCDRLRTDGNP